jgi:hypothetical protein
MDMNTRLLKITKKGVRLAIASIVASFIVLGIAGQLFAAAFYYPTELTYSNPAKAYPGYVLFKPAGGKLSGEDAKIWLLDLNGAIVKEWAFDGKKYWANFDAQLADNGNLLVKLNPLINPDGINMTNADFLNSGGQPRNGLIFQEWDWAGNVVWSLRHPLHKGITRAEFSAITGADPSRLGDAAYVQQVLGQQSLAKRQQLRSKVDYFEHHGYKKIFNKVLGRETILILANKNITPEECYALGANPALSPAPGGPFTAAISADVVSEIDIKTGKVVWEWSTADHFIQNFDSTKRNWYRTIANQSYGGNVEEAFYRRLDPNMTSNQARIGLVPDWIHLNAVDYNPKRGEIIVSSRDLSEIYVIDHDGTFDSNDPYTLAASKKGDIVWRFGSPSNYASSAQLGPAGIPEKAAFPTLTDAKYAQTWGQHDIQWIPDGYPGGGQLLLFDNGMGRPANLMWSSILQLNPYDASGNYRRELSAGYKDDITSMPNVTGDHWQTDLTGSKRLNWRPSNLITWSFMGVNSFYSPYVSGVERLPNGNTFVTSGMEGQIFEVTDKGEIVWEYISPFTPEGRIANSLTSASGAPNYYGLNHDPGYLFKISKYGYDHPAFRGKDLTPTGTIMKPTAYYGFGFGGPGGAGGGGAAGGAGGGAGGGY